MDTSGFTDIAVELRDRVAVVRLNRPEERNALSGPMVAELSAFLALLNDGSYDVRAVIITGEGSSFCAGGNVMSFPAAQTKQSEERYGRPWHPPHSRRSLIQAMRDCDAPIIAAINGYAVGAGWSLALGCDIRIAAEDAVFQIAQTKRGIVADMGLPYLLPRVVGTQRALELMFTGRRIDATEARDLGVVLEVVPSEELMERACLLAEQIAEGPPMSHAGHKRLVYGIESDDLGRVEELTSMFVGKLFYTDDGREGVESFIERREPRFSGR